MKNKRILWNIVKVTYLVLLSVWMLINIFTIHIPDNIVIDTFSSVTGIKKEDIIVRPVDLRSNLSELDKFLYSNEFYGFIGIASGISVVLGFLIIGKGRGLAEKLLLLQSFVIPRERTTWGRVYDLSTNEAVVFATISILEVTETHEVQVVSNTIADLDGRYRLYANLGNGIYHLEVKSTGYQIFRKELGKENVQNLKIISNIGMIKINESSKKSLTALFMDLKPIIYNFLFALTYSISLITIVHELYSLVFHFGLVSVLNLVFYGFAAPWNTYVLISRLRNKPGKFIDESTHKSIGGVSVQLFKDQKQVLSTQTDDKGIVRFDMEPGRYKIRVNKNNYLPISNFSNDNMIDVFINQEGFLQNDILMSLAEGSDSVQSNLLMNPFI